MILPPSCFLLRLPPHRDRIRGGMRPAVRDAEVDLRDPQLFAQFARGAPQGDIWPAPHFIANFDVAPLDAAGPARAESLEHRLFCGESPGIVLRRRLASRAILDLVRREDARQEQLAMPLNHFGDTQALDNVGANSNDGHEPDAERLRYPVA